MNNRFFVTRETEVRFFIILCIILSFFVFFSYLLGVGFKNKDASKPTQAAYADFPHIALQAKAAYVYDARTDKVLYALNENTRMPLASLTKVMSALVAEDLSPAYGAVTITKEALSTEGDSGLKTGEKWALKDLLDFSLVSSSNDGIAAVALSLGALASSNATPEQITNDFVHLMNKKADELDLKNTYYWNETGLDETEYKGGAYGTAKDMATLLNYVIKTHPDMMEATRETEAKINSEEFSHEAKNTNLAAADIPGLIASKTGYTDTAGGNLVFAFDPELGRPIIVTILGSTQSGRFEDAKILVSATLSYLESQKQEK